MANAAIQRQRSEPASAGSEIAAGRKAGVGLPVNRWRERRHPEEPDVWPTSPVLWELGGRKPPRLPDRGAGTDPLCVARQSRDGSAQQPHHGYSAQPCVKRQRLIRRVAPVIGGGAPARLRCAGRGAGTAPPSVPRKHHLVLARGVTLHVAKGLDTRKSVMPGKPVVVRRKILRVRLLFNGWHTSPLEPLPCADGPWRRSLP
jgi:hypothetical protein